MIFDSFKPNTNENQNIICELTPATFDALVKVLSLLDDSNAIYIRDSIICQSIKNGVAILNADITPIVSTNENNENKVNLTILNPKKYLKLFKNIKGNSNVFIIDDIENKRLIIMNEIIKIFLPKQIEETIDNIDLPDMNNCNVIGEPVEVDKTSRNTIIMTGSEAKHYNLLIQSNQLKGVYIPETAIILFDKFAKENIDESNCELILKSFAFLSIPAEKYTLYLGEVDGKHWLATTCNIGFMEINIYENLTVYSDEVLI